MSSLDCITHVQGNGYSITSFSKKLYAALAGADAVVAGGAASAAETEQGGADVVPGPIVARPAFHPSVIFSGEWIFLELDVLLTFVSAFTRFPIPFARRLA